MSYTLRLQGRAYYEDRYDHLMVTRCRMLEEAQNSIAQRNLEEKDGSCGPRTSLNEWDTKIRWVQLYYCKGSIAEKRDERIIEWMDEDREMDEFYKNTNVDNPYCTYCKKKMDPFLKNLESGDKKKKSRILFFFKCIPCKYNRGIWDDGEEYEITKDYCGKCGSEDMKTNLKKGKDYDIFQYTCLSCSHVKEEKWKHYKSRAEELDPNYEKDKERFVSTQKEMDGFREGKRMFEKYDEHFGKKDGWKQGNEHDGVGQPIEKRLLDANDMKVLVAKELKRFKYQDISFGSPSIYKKRVLMDLSLFGKSLDKEEVVGHIRGILGNTNWKLLDKSVQIQLGILNCRLEGT